MNYHFKISKKEKRLCADCIELENIYLEAENKEDLIDFASGILTMSIEDTNNSNEIMPLPDDSIEEAENILQVKVDPEVAFGYYLRMIRLKNNLTVNKAAQMMKFKDIRTYSILESSKKSNPQLTVLDKIKSVFPEFNLNMLV